jgi:hypothetical protein
MKRVDLSRPTSKPHIVTLLDRAFNNNEDKTRVWFETTGKLRLQEEGQLLIILRNRLRGRDVEEEG